MIGPVRILARLGARLVALALIASIAMVGSPAAPDAHAQTCSTSTFVADAAELSAAVDCFNLNGAGNETWVIELTTNIALTTTVTIANGVGFLDLQGAGHTIDGGGIAVDLLEFDAGNVVVDRLTITGATDDGILYNGGVLLVTSSTITSNAYGITAFADLLIVRNSTIHGNTINGIHLGDGVRTEVQSSTIVDNGNVGIENGAATAVVSDSIVARNMTRDCTDPITAASSGNTFGDVTCNATATAGLGASLAASLAPNDCAAPCTNTIALLQGSPAIDAAGICDVTVDQRDVPRSFGACDAGAFEFGDRFGALECDGALVTITAVAGVVTTGTSGADVILGTAGDDVINALGGDDRICSLEGDDTIDAGDGDDAVFAGAGLDVVVAGPGDDVLRGGADRDILRGGPGVDVIHGDAGNDRLLGGIGDDTINGGEGDDYVGGFGGADTINSGLGDDLIFGGFGADTINAGLGDDQVFGLIGNDTINGDGGDDTLNGDRGNDIINGGPGDDVIRGGNANDVLSGNAGNDSVSGGKADDILAGNDGIDVCTGNLQNVTDIADITCETIFGVP